MITSLLDLPDFILFQCIPSHIEFEILKSISKTYYDAFKNKEDDYYRRALKYKTYKQLYKQYIKHTYIIMINHFPGYDLPVEPFIGYQYLIKCNNMKDLAHQFVHLIDDNIHIGSTPPDMNNYIGIFAKRIENDEDEYIGYGTNMDIWADDNDIKLSGSITWVLGQLPRLSDGEKLIDKELEYEYNSDE